MWLMAVRWNWNFTYVVRLPWIAPECYSQLKNMTLGSDLYSFGIALWEMFSTGQRPWEGKAPSDVWSRFHIFMIYNFTWQGPIIPQNAHVVFQIDFAIWLVKI